MPLRGWEPGCGCAASPPHAASHSPLLRAGWCVCAGGMLFLAQVFFQASLFFFFRSKGHCTKDAQFLAARPWCEGRELAAFGRAAESHCQNPSAFVGHPFLSLFVEAFFFL